MNRLTQMSKTNALYGRRIIVTGCGYKPAKHTFYSALDNQPTHDSLSVNGEEMKMNIGTAVSAVLALNGATVHMVSRSEDKLTNIKTSLDELVQRDDLVEYSAVDLMDAQSVNSFVSKLPYDKPLSWIQSVGLGAGSYKLKDSNPYLTIEDIPIELLEKESQIVLRATHLMMQSLLPRFRKQSESRVGIVTSMSAIRGYGLGGTHCAAKGAIDRYTNAAMLNLYKDTIYVSTIRPGGVDTGMYDGEPVQESCYRVADEYNCNWRANGIRLAPPSAVGEAANLILSTPAHIPSLNLVAQGQFPHEGS